MKKWIGTYLLFITCLCLQAQEKLQVVTLNVDKSIEVSLGDKLFINGERAGISISSYEGDFIEINLKLVSKNPNKEEAKEDLKKFKHLIEQYGNEIYLRNYLELAKDEAKPVSNLRAFYTIKVPPNIAIDIENRFGAIELNSLQNEVEIKTEFTNLVMDDINGEIDIQSKFGDIKGNNLRGNYNFTTTRSDINLSGLKGSYTLKTKLGNITIAADKNLYQLDIDSDKSKITFIPFDASSFKYNLSSSYGDLFINTDNDFTFLDNSKKLKHAVFNQQSENSLINIRANFGSIKIN